MTRTPHDAFFKGVFGKPEHAVACFQAYLPQRILEHLDFGTARLRHGSFVDDRLRQRHSDLLYEVQMHGRPALLYLLFEHQRAPDPLMPYRMNGYTGRIWERWLEDTQGAKTLPPVISLVLYHGADAWSGPARLSDLMDAPPELRTALLPHSPELAPLLLDLSALSDAELRGTALGRLALYLFKHIDDAELIESLAAWSSVFLETMASSGLKALQLAISYVLKAGRDVEHERLADTLFPETPEAREVIMSTADRLRQEGFQQGIQQGMQEGIQQGVQRGQQRGKLHLLLRQLQLRFGPLPAEVSARVEAADDELLDLWAERILTAPTLDEVLADR